MLRCVMRSATTCLAAVVTICAVAFAGELAETPATDLAAGAPAKQLIQASGATGGLVVHVGSQPAREFAQWTTELKRDDRFVVHGLYRGPDSMRQVRQAMRELAEYGSVAAETWSVASLPYTDGLVNAIIVTDQGDVAMDELDRVLAPGGVAIVRRGDGYTRLSKPRPVGIDDWTHLLYDASNNAVSNDRTVGPPHHLQWIASPLNSRHHERLASVTVAVSVGGRLFYIIDEAPTASVMLPAQWALVARDAYSGVVLWKRPIPMWEDHLRAFRSGPPELSRTLVGTSERLYVTFGHRAHVTAVDPATGNTMKEYPETIGTEEILCHDGVLYLATRHTDDPTGRSRGLMAVNADSGELLWQQADADPLPMSLTMAGGRVVYMNTEAVVCLDGASGRQVWNTPRDVAKNRPGWSAPTVVINDGVVLVADRWTSYQSAIDEVSGKRVAAWLAQEGWTGDLIAYAADSGKMLWQCPCAETYHAPPDVFVVDGLVWVGQSRSRTGPDFVAGRDIHTGEIKRQLDTSKAWDTTMPHHRCHRNRATQRYIVSGRTGVEFIDLNTGDAYRHHWTRGTCQFGVLPCNGLLYVPPHSCACYIEGKLTGLLALAPRTTGESPVELASQIASPHAERGPAWSARTAAAAASGGASSPADEWPTYRHDSLRSAGTSQQITAAVGVVWDAKPGRTLTSPVVADGKVFVAVADVHAVHALSADTGQPVWAFTAGGRVDSPPTVAQGHVVFGSSDGYVYCLRSSDGQLAWRFRAAPQERRIMAFGQLESAWPVHGSVLVQDDAVYFVAGRSSYLDDGMYLFRLDLQSGDVLAHQRIYSRDPETGEQPDEPMMFDMPGALPDVLATDGQLIYMRHLAFDRESLEQRSPARHVYSPAGFLSSDWWHRTYWIDGTHFYSGYIGWYFAGREAPAGRLLTFTDTQMYGYGYVPNDYRGATGRNYHLFALKRSNQPEQPPADYRRANRDYPPNSEGKFHISFQWSERVPLLVRSMVLSRDKLFAVGPPEKALVSRRVFDGASGARLVVVSTDEGKQLRAVSTRRATCLRRNGRGLWPAVPGP